MPFDDSPRYATVRDYLQVVRRRKWLILVIAIIFGAAVYVRDHNKTPTYEASAKLQFFDQKLNTGGFGALIPQDISPDARAAMHAQSVATLVVARRAASALHEPAKSAPALLDQIGTQVEATTDFVIVTADAATAGAAARLANAWAGAAVAQAQADLASQYTRETRAIQREINGLSKNPRALYYRVVLTNQLHQLQQGQNVVQPATVVQSARPPSSPSSPQTARDTGLGVVAGLAIALLIAFILDSFDSRYTGAAAVGRDLGLPILGVVRDETLGRAPAPAKGRKPLSDSDVETFRILRSKIALLDLDDPVKTVLVTSAVPEEGKSTVAAALASAFAQSGKSTLLLEADLRAPRMAKRLGLAESPGLTDSLVSATDPRQPFGADGPAGADGRALPSGDAAPAAPEPAGNGAAHGTAGVFDCIVAGSLSPKPAEMLASQQVTTLLARLRDAYDVVVIDSAPVLPVSDTLELLPHMDCVVMCLRVSKTPRDHARAAKTVIAELTSAPLALVLTGVKARNGLDPYAAYAYSGEFSSADRRWFRARARAGASSS